MMYVYIKYILQIYYKYTYIYSIYIHIYIYIYIYIYISEVCFKQVIHCSQYFTLNLQISRVLYTYIYIIGGLHVTKFKCKFLIVYISYSITANFKFLLV